MYSAVGLGQVGIDFMPDNAGGTLLDARQFQCLPGGTPANCLVAMARLGLSVVYFARLGKDWWGKRIAQDLQRFGVITDFLAYDPESPSTIAFSTDGLNSDPQFMVYGFPGAFSCLEPTDIHEEVINNSHLFIFGSLTLDSDPTFSATWRGIDIAQKHGCTIVFDPNYRPPQWSDPGVVKSILIKAASISHLLKINRLELELLTGSSDPTQGQKLLNHTTELVIVTLGADGAAFINKSGFTYVKAVQTRSDELNTLGCGDAFLGVLLSGLLGEFTNEGFPIHSWQNSEDIARLVLLGNLAGAITAERTGIWDAFPNREDLFSQFHERCE
jgi:sugar/nucleoside kinase (ribokinase family)